MPRSSGGPRGAQRHTTPLPPHQLGGGSASGGRRLSHRKLAQCAAWLSCDTRHAFVRCKHCSRYVVAVGFWGGCVWGIIACCVVVKSLPGGMLTAVVGLSIR